MNTVEELQRVAPQTPRNKRLVILLSVTVVTLGILVAVLIFQSTTQQSSYNVLPPISLSSEGKLNIENTTPTQPKAKNVVLPGAGIGKRLLLSDSIIEIWYEESWGEPSISESKGNVGNLYRITFEGGTGELPVLQLESTDYEVDRDYELICFECIDFSKPPSQSLETIKPEEREIEIKTIVAGKNALFTRNFCTEEESNVDGPVGCSSSVRFLVPQVIPGYDLAIVAGIEQEQALHEFARNLKITSAKANAAQN